MTYNTAAVWIAKCFHANVITLLHVILSFIALLWWTETSIPIGPGLLFTGAAFLDLADGRIARIRRELGFKDNQQLGELIDPLADKLVTLAYSIAVCVLVGRLATWPSTGLVCALVALCLNVGGGILALVVRCAMFVRVHLLAWEAEEIPLQANAAGKRKTLAQNTGACLFFLVIGADGPFLSEMAWVTAYFWGWAVLEGHRSYKEHKRTVQYSTSHHARPH